MRSQRKTTFVRAASESRDEGLKQFLFNHYRNYFSLYRKVYIRNLPQMLRS
jgi:hypothetical protein